MLVSLFGYTSVDNMVSMIGALGCIPFLSLQVAIFRFQLKQRSSDKTFGSFSTKLVHEAMMWFGLNIFSG